MMELSLSATSFAILLASSKALYAGERSIVAPEPMVIAFLLSLSEAVNWRGGVGSLPDIPLSVFASVSMLREPQAPGGLEPLASCRPSDSDAAPPRCRRLCRCNQLV